MTKQRLLLSLAHPDDESFGSGGLIARYSSKGAEVDYLVGTNGNRGTVAPEYLERYGSIEALRYAELDCAAAVLGFHEVIRLDYDDSGMMGSPHNDNPQCLWQAWQQAPERLTEQVVAVMRRLKPQVVITFDPYGGYGHPDHIVMHHATTAAFHAAGRADAYPDAGPPYQPQKLYYSSFPKTLLRFWMWQMRWRGEDPRAAGTNKDMDFYKVLENAQSANTFINVRPYLAQWDAASRCHASQVNPRVGMSKWARHLFFAHQGLKQVHPPVPEGKRLPGDLFAGVRLD